MNLLRRFCGWVARTRYPAVPVGLGLLLAIPTLWGGLLFDDYSLRASIRGDYFLEGVWGDPWQPFAFLDGDPQRNYKLMDFGFMPWWSAPECKAAFMRPVTGLTHVLDFRLLDGYPALMHLQSLAWFGLLLWAAAVLYRRLMGPTIPGWIPALAAVLFALDDAHGVPAGWLASRNSVLAGLFGVLAIIAYDRWRRDGWRPGAVLAPVALLTALLCKESAVCAGAYLLAYAMFLDRGTPVQRAARLLPCLLTGVLWYAAYRALGFGMSHSGVYTDPGHDPVEFVRRLITDGPILLLGQFGFPPSQVSLLLSASTLRLYWLGSLAFMALLGVLLGPMVVRHRLGGFFAVGSLLSILPACAAFASDRLLMFVGLGGAGLVALFIGGIREQAPWRPSWAGYNLAARVAAYLFIAVHVVAAPLMFQVSLGAFQEMDDVVRKLMATAPDDPQLERQRIVLVNSPSWFYDLGMLQVLHYEGRRLPRGLLHLASSSAVVQLKRTDARTLVVRPQGGYLPPRGGPPGAENSLPAASPRYAMQFLDRLFRGPQDHFVPGRPLELSDVTITVTELTEDGRAAEAEFRFGTALEDPSLRWLATAEQGLVAFTLPAVDETVEVYSFP